MSVTRRGLTLPKNRYQSMSVKAGVLAGATYPDESGKKLADGTILTKDPRAGMPVAAIAMALNYGTSKVPARPFMEKTIADRKAEWTKGLTVMMTMGYSAEIAMGQIGQAMKDDIKSTISEWPADNSDAWAAKKRFNHGLIWTSHLLNSVEWELVQ